MLKYFWQFELAILKKYFVRLRLYCYITQEIWYTFNRFPRTRYLFRNLGHRPIIQHIWRWYVCTTHSDVSTGGDFSTHIDKRQIWSWVMCPFVTISQLFSIIILSFVGIFNALKRCLIQIWCKCARVNVYSIPNFSKHE